MRLIAHRGITYSHLENSKEAILEAVNSPLTDGVEFDVRMTKDDNLVVIHNITPMIPFECPMLVSEMTLQELKKLKYQNYRISTLDEILSSINSDKIMMIEMKTGNEYINYVNVFNACINKYTLNYYICSFNERALMYFHNLNSKPKVGLIKSTTLNKLPLFINFLSIKYWAITTDYINKLADQLSDLFVWTVNECINVNHKVGIITDDPQLLTNCNKKEA